MLLLICHSFVPVVLLSFIFSQVVTSQFELRWSRCMLIWVYPENCVSYIWPDKHIKTHTYNKANTLSAWSLSFSLTPVLEDSSSQTTFCPLVFLILHCFLSAFISVIPVHQVRTKTRKSLTCQWHWRMLWLLFFYGYEKKLGIMLASVWTQRFKQCLKKKSRTESRHKKAYHFDKVSAHAAYNNLVHEENNESLYCSSERL